MADKEIKLDIGCGKNKKEGFIGIDIDPNSNADITASALNLPFENSSVDEIICSHLVEHFPPAELQKFFDEIYRVLKPGAKAWLKADREWSEGRLLRKDPDHKKRYSAKEIEKMVGKFSYSEVKREIYRFGWHIRNKIFIRLKK
ncbi:MAG: hypothetical protein CMI54_01320 [Parcubacteria group bacterium]|nr:hypothetical protein [Parcubacteria group bacterium]|tara:strand:+ start:2861 stop:3292 length:432 start_codon:yes stop_codon:yes gene_type:complete